MLKPFFEAWVKNVYSLRIQSRKIRESLSPINWLYQPQPSLAVQNHRQFHLKISVLPAYLSTIKIMILPLLLSSFTHNPQGLLLQRRKEN